VSGSWYNSKKHIGYRALLYHAAEQSRAFYNDEGQKTIWYENDDLKFSLLFKREEDAENFQNILAKEVRHHSYSLEYDEKIEKLCYLMELTRRIFLTHYRTDEEASPPYLSVVDQISNSTATSVVDNDEGSEHSLQALENLSKLAPHLQLYRCHLASKKDYSEFVSDPDNVIYASHHFHS
jgi:hypothetical protein